MRQQQQQFEIYDGSNKNQIDGWGNWGEKST